ncbi:hypothetical protein, partial [Nostocoides sp.]|uniref:hypothetical protein n=1 Tax=Nostocoides sp. TaxID=1917966 RepID=UPI003BAF3C16
AALLILATLLMRCATLLTGLAALLPVLPVAVLAIAVLPIAVLAIPVLPVAVLAIAVLGFAVLGFATLGVTGRHLAAPALPLAALAESFLAGLFLPGLFLPGLALAGLALGGTAAIGARFALTGGRGPVLGVRPGCLRGGCLRGDRHGLSLRSLGSARDPTTGLATGDLALMGRLALMVRWGSGRLGLS